MLVLQYTFTRPNTSVAFYTAAGNDDVKAAITTLSESGDFISFGDSTSSNGLVLTRTMRFPDQASLNRVSANSVLAANKNARVAYNSANGITETVATGIV